MLNFEYTGISGGKYVTDQIEALNKEEAADAPNCLVFLHHQHHG